MKTLILTILLAGLATTGAAAQDRIYRCGNEYTNTVTDAQARHCKLVSGGNVTVVQAVKPNPARAAAPSGAARVDAGDQRAKDSDARLILATELKRSEARQVELLKEYNNGQPERLTVEQERDPVKYQQRVAELKASISRNESDIEGIRRELARMATQQQQPPASAPR